MSPETILKYLLETPPTVRSPYRDEEGRPMHPIVRQRGATLFIHPKGIIDPDEPTSPEVLGVAWHWKGEAGWIGESRAGSFEDLAETINRLSESGAVLVEIDSKQARPQPEEMML